MGRWDYQLNVYNQSCVGLWVGMQWVGVSRGVGITLVPRTLFAFNL